MPYRASFILRCQVNRTGNTVIVLIDVRTGLEYLFVDLDALPDLIRKLLAQTQRPRTSPERTATLNKPPGEGVGQ